MSREPDHRGSILIAIAREQLTNRLLDTPLSDLQATWGGEGWLFEPGAVFITLRHHGTLRGCVGSLEAVRPLIEDVRYNAIAAATRDTRFPPLDQQELGDVRIEVSLLSPPEPLQFDNEADALAQLRPGDDGVVLQHGARRSTFLPQVWDTLPERQDFVAQLKKKAGLAPDFWDEDIRLERYGVEKWCEA
ncbi:MAG: AmmeMemoRadiSam system protein A [Acidobacteriota bacterium]